MQFSTMTMNMFLPQDDDPADDHRIIGMTVDQAIWFAELGFNPWFTDHHFKGPFNSDPMQFAAYIAPQIPRERYLGFGVITIPFYHPLRVVESMNLLDQLTRGRALFGVGSGWQRNEAAGLGVDVEYHASGRAAEDTLEVMERLWSFGYGDPEYHFAVGSNSGAVRRRVMPAPYTLPHPTIIRTVSREAAIVRTAKKGWPAFLGIFGSDLHRQVRIYRQALHAANHPASVVENCLKWCSCDWLSVTVADTDEEAQARARIAHAEQMAIRTAYIARHDPIGGAVMNPTPGKSTASAFARGDDMIGALAGSPDTIAAKVQELADLGINHLHTRFAGEWAGRTRHIAETSARLFASEVMPRFAGKPAVCAVEQVG